MRRPMTPGRRRLVQAGATAAAVAALAGAVGAARAVLVVVAAAMFLAVARWPRLEARVFRTRPTRAVPAASEVWARPVARRTGTPGLGAEGHRAYAQALHAVTGAYLAECDREASR